MSVAVYTIAWAEEGGGEQETDNNNIMIVFLEHLSMWNMISCTEIKIIKRMYMRHPKMWGGGGGGGGVGIQKERKEKKRIWRK